MGAIQYMELFGVIPIVGSIIGIWIEIDTSVENNLVLRLPEPITFTGREVIYFEAETDVSNTKVSLRFSGIETDS